VERTTLLRLSLLALTAVALAGCSPSWWTTCIVLCGPPPIKWDRPTPYTVGEYQRDAAACDSRATFLLAQTAGMYGRGEAAQRVFMDCMIERGWQASLVSVAKGKIVRWNGHLRRFFVGKFLLARSRRDVSHLRDDSPPH
jgi:hypothetical protein